MTSVTLRAFTGQDTAKSYFENSIIESDIVDGVMIKVAGKIFFRQDDGHLHDLTDGEKCFLVVSYNKGTGISIDTNTTEVGDGGAE